MALFSASNVAAEEITEQKRRQGGVATCERIPGGSHTRTYQFFVEELRDAQDRLVQTEKLASLGQLTHAGIAHEIKNPLNFVNNFLKPLN